MPLTRSERREFDALKASVEEIRSDLGSLRRAIAALQERDVSRNQVIKTVTARVTALARRISPLLEDKP